MSIRLDTIPALHVGQTQCRLIQWARRARAQGPQASGGPQTADALIFSSREISVTNCVLFTG